MRFPPKRRAKYTNADSLFANCLRDGDCYIWPVAPTMPAPLLSPDSPMAKKFHTTGVVRILFSIVRFFPASTRMVRWCPTKHCVNPYHHTEAGVFVQARMKMRDPTLLLPQQEEHRHLLGPSDEEIEAMKPTNPELLRHLAETAARAGFDCKGIPNHRHQDAFKRKVKVWTPPPGAPVAEEGVPVLVVKGYNDKPAVQDTGPQKVSDEEWAEIENMFAQPKSLPDVVDERADVEHPEPTDDIFAMITRRKEWEQNRK